MEVAVKFPNANVVLVHSGHDQEGHQLTLEAARNLSNVYLDFSGTERDFGLIEEYISVLGASRVVFSTDMPYLDPRSALGRVTFAEITEEEKAQVLGLNAIRLLRLGKNKEVNS
jgi:predicted TIM-barrel fold metal-dependent hydrolase